MKTIRYILAISLFVLPTIFTSCSSDFLDVQPTRTITQDKTKELPDALKAQVTGLYSWLIKENSLGLAKPQHSDFGHLGIMLMTDLMNEDMLQNTANYGWFYDSYDFTLRPRYDVVDVYMPWRYYYRLVKNANDIIGAFTADVTDEEVLQYKGQALAMRAFAYLYLVQLYQHTYVGHQNDLAVPIVTDQTPDAQKSNNPRATVKAVYDLMLADLMEAYTLLENYQRPSKVQVDKQVVAGLLARVYLNMEDGTNAAKYAKIARTGYTASTKEWSYDKAVEGTGFIDISEPDWMWGADVTDQSDIAKSGIINPTAHLSSISYGYATAGNMQKMIDANLFSKISSSDIRRKAFAESDMTVLEYKVPKYANLKFGRYDTKTDDNFGDCAFMRASEMYLIEAEGYVLAGRDVDAQNVLFDFVKTRNPSYVKPISVGQALRNEIYLQRRIELWGEGFSYFDHKRMKLAIDRSYQGTNHRADAMKDFPAEADVFRFRIPRQEIINNPGIPASANNP